MINANLGQNIGSSISSGISNIANTTGLSAVDSALENFTKKNSFTNAIADITNGNKFLNINTSTIELRNGVPTGPAFTAVSNSVAALDKTIKLNEYLPPTTISLKTLDKMGAEIDKTLSSSFLLQTFNVKTTDVLCSAFCFLLSMMSCESRNELYNSIQKANNAAQALSSGANAINQSISAIGGIAASIDNINAATNSIFNNIGTNNDTSSILSSTSTIAAAPGFIIDKVKIITNALKLGIDFKFMMPDVEGKTLWDMGRHILHILEGHAMQAADEALSKLMKPLEDMIKNTMPAECYGTSAMRLKNQIIKTIGMFKSNLLAMLTKLMVGDEDFNVKLKEFNLKSADALEMQAFSNALEYVAAHFFDVAVACGVSHCGKDSVPRADQYKSKDIGNIESIYPFSNDFPFSSSSSPINNIPRSNSTMPIYVNSTSPIIRNNIDDIANKFTFNNTGNTFVTKDSIISVYDLGATPNKIVNLINSGMLNNMLDNNYSIYNNNGSISIVNTIKRNCGDNN